MNIRYISGCIKFTSRHVYEYSLPVDHTEAEQ